MQNSTFKQRINSVLKDNAIERYTKNKKKGKLDFRSIHKIALSNKIFKQKEERKGKDYSITLLLDRSASMDNVEKIVASIAQDFQEIFTEVNIPNSFYCFTDDTYKLKDFQENIKDVKNGYLKVYSAGTDDAYALHVVGNEITKKYKKNILIVLTDGQGNDYSNREEGVFTKNGVDLAKLKNAKTVTKGLLKNHKDLEIFCLGIGDQSLNKYVKDVYGSKRAITISTIDQARVNIIKLISRIIKK